MEIRITNVKKQNSLYYSVFFDWWTQCPCSSVREEVVLRSDGEVDITIDTPGLKERVLLLFESANKKS